MLLRFQPQLMRLRSLDSRVRVRQREGDVSIPCRPVVHVVGAEGLAGFAEHDVERRRVQIREVDGHALGRAEGASHLLDSEASSRLRLSAGTGPMLEAGY